MMKITSVNAGKAKTVSWSGKKYRTGIFKSPVTGPLELGTHDVLGDQVIDRRYHGGIDKACYAFSRNEYDFWSPKYPELVFQPGMFGENLTIEDLNEDLICIGDTFQIGTAVVQVSEPRQPCVKLNIRFNSKQTMKEFIARERCGVYFRVLQPGKVAVNDEMILISKGSQTSTIREVFQLLYGIGQKEKALALLSNEELGISVRSELKRIWKC